MNGHIADRYTVSRACVVCCRNRAIAFQSKNPGKNAEAQARYRAKNPDKAREYEARRRSEAPDSVRAALRKYASNNPEKMTAKWSARRARKLNATPPWFGELDELVMLEAHDLAKRRQAATGIKWEVDHMIPLQARNACGLHVASNIQVIPATMNAAKCNKMRLTEPGEWLRHG